MQKWEIPSRQGLDSLITRVTLLWLAVEECSTAVKVENMKSRLKTTADVTTHLNTIHRWELRMLEKGRKLILNADRLWSTVHNASGSKVLAIGCLAKMELLKVGSLEKVRLFEIFYTRFGLAMYLAFSAVF
jgi:hypothetical protein